MKNFFFFLILLAVSCGGQSSLTFWSFRFSHYNYFTQEEINVFSIHTWLIPKHHESLFTASCCGRAGGDFRPINLCSSNTNPLPVIVVGVVCVSWTPEGEPMTSSLPLKHSNQRFQRFHIARH